MAPLIRSGDLILLVSFVKPRKLASQSVGDIVLIREDGEWIAHRVVLCAGIKVIKGDGALGVTMASAHTDGQAAIAVWGKVIGIHRNGLTLRWGYQGPAGKRIFAWLSTLQLSGLQLPSKCARLAAKVLAKLLWLAPFVFQIRAQAQGDRLLVQVGDLRTPPHSHHA